MQTDDDDSPIIEPVEIRSLIGIVIGGLGAMVGNAGQCLTLISAEFMSGGEHARARKAAAQARREAGYEIERIVEP